MKKILVINGPNLNMLGLRDSNHYGKLTLRDINYKMKELSNYKIKFYQNNSEGKIVSYIQKHLDYDAYILNLGAYTHTSIAIRDALELIKGIKVEVHLSDVNNREEFRKINYIRDIVNASFVGLKEESYYKAIDYVNNYLANFEKIK